MEEQRETSRIYVEFAIIVVKYRNIVAAAVVALVVVVDPPNQTHGLGLPGDFYLKLQFKKLH